MDTTHTKRRRKKILIWFCTILGVLVLGGSAYAYHVYSSVNQTLQSVHQPIRRDVPQKRPEPVEVAKKEPISILLLGVDERSGDRGRGRSDSLMLVTANPNEKTTKLLSIPRDSYTEIVGKGKKDKINHAYAYGGTAMSLQTVENFLNVPIDYYIEVNMEGFRDIVDAVGGVTVQNTRPFTYEEISFPKGEVRLNGTGALSYTRMRKEDPNGDFGRQERQRQVIQAVIQKGASLSTLTHYDDILKAIQKHVRTNLKPDEMLRMQKDYKDSTDRIEQIQIPGEGKVINGVWYYVVTDETKKQLSDQLRKHLEVAPGV
ncbi:LytR family transcriptional regulator [Microbacteriaceae bacterium 4G12]